MLTNPRYQANAVRLEALVHLSLITADGTAVPSLRSISQCLHDLGHGQCGLMEDPAEDLFVGNVITQNRNFRVIEGLWESGSFYLQRFMDVVESTPAEPPFIRLRQSTIAILQLSDALCERAGLNRYHAGAEFPQGVWPEEELANIRRQLVFFSNADLDALGVDRSLLDRLRSTVYIVVDFLALSDMGPITEIPDEADIRQSISADLHRKDGMVVLSVGEAFERGMQDVSNVSERVLVGELCRALFDLFHIEVTDETFQRLLTQIVPNDAARYVHAFYVSQFRDFVSPSLRGQIIESDELDSAILRSGLAFCVESRTKGRFSTRSKRQATQLLNSLVQSLESELIGVCQNLNRNQLLELALWNHERAVQSRQRWMRTAKANFALRQESSGVAEVIAARDIELSDTIFASLIVAEIALCESPVEGGLQPGTLDLCRLQCLAGAIAHFGGWSDAIHMDAMSPRLTITALGDVQVDDEFRSQILMPFAKAGSEGRIREAIHRYAGNFEPPSLGNSNRTLNSDFEDAWKTEFGFSILEMRQAIDLLEDIGIKQAVAIFSMSWSEFVRLVESVVADATKFIDAFVLNSRVEWREIPAWCDVRDRERGWHAQAEQDVHSLVHCGRDPDFGDVDVVAWNVDAKRILIIECKHLYYGKTAGEIAEQLRDYRGRVRQDGRRKRRDDLRKHLDRIEVITQHQAVLLNTLGLPHDMRIEGWIVFKNPVPMLFGWEVFADRVQIATFEDIDRIVGLAMTAKSGL